MTHAARSATFVAPRAVTSPPSSPCRLMRRKRSAARSRPSPILRRRLERLSVTAAYRRPAFLSRHRVRFDYLCTRRGSLEAYPISSFARVRPREAGRVFLQTARVLPLLRRPAHSGNPGPGFLFLRFRTKRHLGTGDASQAACEYLHREFCRIRRDFFTIGW